MKKFYVLESCFISLSLLIKSPYCKLKKKINFKC
jgi:hypothetical protein